MPAASRRELRVLIVPEDLLGDDIGASFLDRKSLNTRKAVNADQALAIAEAWRPQLVVMRSRLGQTPVSLFCRTLKRRGDEPKLIMVTDHVGHSLDDATEAACDAHLVSPVPPQQLLDTMGTLLGLEQRRSRRAPLEVLVHVEGFVGQGAVDSTLANAVSLSEDGMLIESNCQLRLNSRGRLHFFLPGHSTRVALAGEVRLAVDEVRLMYAIDFVDLAPRHRAEIRRYLAAQEASS